MNTLQPNDRHQERYKKVLETGELGPDLLGRSSSAIRYAGSKLGNITSNLIFVFSKFGFWSAFANRTETTIAATRKPRDRPLRIPYALFCRESGSYQCVGENHVDASSEDTVELLHGGIHAHIRAIPPYNEETGHEIIVYEVRRLTAVWPDC